MNKGEIIAKHNQIVEIFQRYQTIENQRKPLTAEIQETWAKIKQVRENSNFDISSKIQQIDMLSDRIDELHDLLPMSHDERLSLYREMAKTIYHINRDMPHVFCFDSWTFVVDGKTYRGLAKEYKTPSGSIEYKIETTRIKWKPGQGL